ncbi:MAG: hypothetical protein RL219_2156 [Actinomycetota bacterium]
MQVNGERDVSRFPSAIRALAYRPFRLFWFGAAVSGIGSLMQAAALAWIVAAETQSALRTTLITLATLAPIAVLGPWAGALADRHDRRRMLHWFTIAGLVQAVATWAAWVAGLHSYGVLFALSLATGVLTAITSPSWQSFLADLVPPGAVQNAVMLNSTQNNLARAVGPMGAGLVIAHQGPSWCFAINVFSFLATLWALSALPEIPLQMRSSGNTGVLRGFRIAGRHALERRGLLASIVAHFVFATVAIPVNSLVPIYAVTVLDKGAGSYGLLAGCVGVGAIMSAFVIGTIDRRVRPSTLLLAGTCVGTVGLAVLAATSDMGVAVVMLSLYGVAYLVFTAINLAAVQRLSHPRIRGRMASLWMQSYGVGLPVGLVVQGVLADRWGVQTMLAIDAVILGAGALVGMVSRGLRPMDVDVDEFDSAN